MTRKITNLGYVNVDFRVKILDNIIHIEFYSVLQLGILDMKDIEEISSKTEINLLVHFHPERKTYDNFMNLTFVLEDITVRKVKIITPELLSEIIKQRVLDEVDYVIVNKQVFKPMFSNYSINKIFV